ncbi:MAG: STAS domain-containing protein [Casimicrobiaceae bacterium]
MTDAASAAAGAFVATEDGARWRFEGALTMDTAAGVLEAASVLPLPGSGVVDFDGLRHADSAALAVMIALKRRGVSEGRSIALESVPSTLISLAVVYGVESLLAA